MLEEMRSKFLNLGDNVKFGENINISGADKFWIGKNVELSQGVNLLANPNGNSSKKVRITLMDRIFLGVQTIIESFNEIFIEEDVLIAARAYISDSQHSYTNPILPIKYQGIQSLDNSLIIKRGAWIGHSATVIGNITIGNGSVIGANSVVNFDVPSHCVIYGNPGRVKKIYDYNAEKWLYPATEEQLIDILENRGVFNGYDDREIIKALKENI